MASVDAEQWKWSAGAVRLTHLRAAPPQVSLTRNKIRIAHRGGPCAAQTKWSDNDNMSVAPHAMLKTDRAFISCFTNPDYDHRTVHCQRRQHDLDAAIRSIHARQHDGGARVRLSKASAGQGQSGHSKTHCRRNPGGVPEGADFLRRSQNCKQQPFAGTFLAEGFGRLMVHGFGRSFWLRTAPPTEGSRCERKQSTPSNFPRSMSSHQIGNGMAERLLRSDGTGSS